MRPLPCTAGVCVKVEIAFDGEEDRCSRDDTGSADEYDSIFERQAAADNDANYIARADCDQAEGEQHRDRDLISISDVFLENVG